MSINNPLLETARQLRLKKALSQNFLVDERILKAIVNTLQETDPALPVIEIGSGAGFLTQSLLETTHPLTAIEVDPNMARVLQDRFRDHPRFHLLQQDVRQVDLLSLVQPRGLIVGNLPYHLTGPILFQLTGELADTDYPLRRHLEKIVIMVQKEVGDRLLAQPGDSPYSQLTLQAQFWFTICHVVFVPRTAFFPAPKVDSVVIELCPRSQPVVESKDPAFLSRLIKASFLHRRKTILNNLKLGGFAPEAVLKHTLVALDISPQARPQNLSIQQYGALADVLSPDL